MGRAGARGHAGEEEEAGDMMVRAPEDRARAAVALEGRGGGGRRHERAQVAGSFVPFTDVDGDGDESQSRGRGDGSGNVG